MDSPGKLNSPGKIVLMGSGETAPNMQAVYTQLFSEIGAPVRMAIVETPAGFEPNAAAVAGQVAAYVERRLQNFRPLVWQIPARTRSHPNSTDDPQLAAGLHDANVIFMGPGSPTYAVRQLRESHLWWTLQARHRMGAALVFASAGVLAISAFTLPVYEIYKVGEDLHWKPGLDLLGPFGLSLVCISHWNNRDGGSALDTSRCFMGEGRFQRLLSLLPERRRQTILGVDEKTALSIDLRRKVCKVAGLGGVIVLRGENTTTFPPQSEFPLDLLGAVTLPQPSVGIPSQIWEEVCAGVAAVQHEEIPPPQVLSLAEERQEARQQRDWGTSDRLRDEIKTRGWIVRDTVKGFLLEKAVEQQ